MLSILADSFKKGYLFRITEHFLWHIYLTSKFYSLFCFSANKLFPRSSTIHQHYQKHKIVLHLDLKKKSYRPFKNTLALTTADYSRRENRRLSKSLIMSFLSPQNTALFAECVGHGIMKQEWCVWRREWEMGMECCFCMIKLSARWHRPRWRAGPEIWP